jgi:deoxycytidine triphosphate deaminase
MPSPLDDPNFKAQFAKGPAQYEGDAKERFRRTAQCDPFPEIPAALLNSSDFYNYVSATGMVFPFEENQSKSASYAVRVGQKAIYWDGDDILGEIALKSGQTFKVPPNSIVYIKTKETFRLPTYIAMRFNLKINNVHRGILLGTGPLVDPGYEGHLLIPLHNLTTNTYYFHEGDTFVWAEFTKVSPYSDWDPACGARYVDYHLHAKYVPFPKEKKNLTEWQYLSEAHPGSVRSSISDTIASVRRFRNVVTYSGVFAVLAFIYGTFSGLTPYLVGLKGDVSAVGERLTAYQSARNDAQSRDLKLIDDLAREVSALRDELTTLHARDDSARLTQMEARISSAEAQIQQLSDRLSRRK